MTIIMTCDHHGAGTGIPDYRSRKVILEQFAAASAVGDALTALAQSGVVIHLKADQHGPGFKPTIELPLAEFMTLWDAYRTWKILEPKGDALVPPFACESIRVPSDDGAAEGASQSATGEQVPPAEA